LRAAFDAATNWLIAHADEVDALNVYPVPDGDTGSNMAETMRAAIAEADATEEANVGVHAAALAHGALMGARGNSGVILSQLLRGFAHSVHGAPTLTPLALAQSLQEAAGTAYRAVMRPVEGTVLTVARLAGEEAARAVAERAEFPYVLRRTLDAARRALAETQHQLPALRQAGVVDAGGRGYVLLLEGAERWLQGKQDGPAPRAAVSPAAGRAGADVHAQLDHFEGGYGYCSEFLIVGKDLQEDAARAHFAAFGDSLLVVGDSGVLRVHIHTEDPGRALTYAAGLGRLQRVKVQDMSEQFVEFAAERPPPASSPSADLLPVGIVAVAAGAGFRALFESMGAAVVSGGQSMNPSTEEILSAVRGREQDVVIILPNNKNVVLAGEQAAGLSDKQVHIVPTRTVPQGIAALLAVRFDAAPSRIVADMEEAARQVRTAELTVAVRDVELGGLPVHKGDVLGLLDGDVVAAGAAMEPVLADVLARMPAEHYEVATAYLGQDASESVGEELRAFLHQRYPMLQLELQSGGQPHYQIVLSVE
jgi:DAK2 domain fusion protein YloV